MSDHYVKVKVQLEQMKALGEDAEMEDAEDAEGQVPVGPPPPAPAPTDTPSMTKTSRDASMAPKHRAKNRSKLGKDDNNSCGKHIVVPGHAGRNLNRLGHERTLHIRGTGEILHAKSEANRNYATIHSTKNIHDAGLGDGFKPAKKKGPVTVDTAKAKTSLEALKISIKQLNWKEVCYCDCFVAVVLSCLADMPTCRAGVMPVKAELT